MMKSVPALLLLEWEGKGAGGKSARFVLKILHDGGRGLVELGFYENLASHADGPGAQGKVCRHARCMVCIAYLYDGGGGGGLAPAC